MNKLVMVGVVVALGVGGVALMGGGGSSFTAKVKGGSSVTVDYKAVSDYVTMEADGEAKNVGSMITIPYKGTVKKAFESILVNNKNAAENNAISIHGGKEGAKIGGKLFLPRNQFMDEVALAVVTLSE